MTVRYTFGVEDPATREIHVGWGFRWSDVEGMRALLERHGLVVRVYRTVGDGNVERIRGEDQGTWDNQRRCGVPTT